MRCLTASRLFSLAFTVTAFLSAQQPSGDPQLIRFDGCYHAAHAQTPPGAISATFAIYRDQHDGMPLWSEVRNIQPDNDGHYTVMLPARQLNTGEARWLEVEVEGLKQPRVLLGGTPYARKTHPTLSAALAPQGTNGSPGCIGLFVDPTDIGCSAIEQGTYQGNPALSFGVQTDYLGAMTMVGSVASGDATGLALYNAAGGNGASVSLDLYSTFANDGIPQAKIKAIDDGAYSDNITFWTKNPGAPTNSIAERMRITSTGNVGIGTASPAQKLEVNGMGRFDGGIMFGDGTIQYTAGAGSGGGTSQWTTIASSISYNFGNVGIGTSSPSQKLEVNGTGRFDGGIMFGDGSMLTTANAGTVNTVIAGTDLTGGGSGGVVTLNLDTTKVAQLSAANVFTANQTVDGSVHVNGPVMAGIGSFSSIGIGVSSPAQLLEVDGDAQVDGNILLSGKIQSAGTNIPLFQSPTDGSGNFSAGYNALQTATYNSGNGQGGENTALGTNALKVDSSGNQNLAAGYNALNNNSAGGLNTALGGFALTDNTTGFDNTGVGAFALSQLNSGSNNTAIGANAGSQLSSGSNNIYIANACCSGDNGVIRIGASGTQSSAYIAGISGVNVNGVPVLVTSSGQLGVASSSRRFKQDIEDMGEASQGLLRLRPVTYRYKQPFEDGSQPIQYGLIAEEVEKVYPELVAHSADGQVETVKYQLLDSMLLNEVQRLHAQNAAQQEKIQSLEERLARLESMLEGRVTAGGN